ncbi:hypothetical protein Taro_009041 [Colocasia esculenta]|uniref:Uncharacterized protein n=1 Tax=Colocasia esculenta TaxID=4460 RepID=A0A843U597_COLES|nr:hypothetical protein [Colocasia esculenta]
MLQHTWSTKPRNQRLTPATRRGAQMERQPHRCRATHNPARTAENTSRKLHGCSHQQTSLLGPTHQQLTLSPPRPDRGRSCRQQHKKHLTTNHKSQRNGLTLLAAASTGSRGWGSHETETTSERDKPSSAKHRANRRGSTTRTTPNRWLVAHDKPSKREARTDPQRVVGKPATYGKSGVSKHYQLAQKPVALLIID